MNTITVTQAGHLAAVLTVAEARCWPMPVGATLLPDGRIALELASPLDVEIWADDPTTPVVTYDHQGAKHRGAEVDVIDCPVHVWAPLMAVAQ